MESLHQSRVVEDADFVLSPFLWVSLSTVREAPKDIPSRKYTPSSVYLEEKSDEQKKEEVGHCSCCKVTGVGTARSPLLGILPLPMQRGPLSSCQVVAHFYACQSAWPLGISAEKDCWRPT